MLSLHSYMGT
ncbi:hypothetical protein PENNAL_c0923G00559 [Penicillium nalgiovense]|uniref:Uncharacterized protein n=1 Tax=Penicillium nalgiovense TaxID=60175 RepID=A0A1V6U3Q5_PENNA|nr:hypothetical protein PENNAL_c0923G00559 [Penicillium nalgiovense]